MLMEPLYVPETLQDWQARSPNLNHSANQYIPLVFKDYISTQEGGEIKTGKMRNQNGTKRE